MTAAACLRVAVEADRTGLSPAVLGPLVSKLASAYLETRWLWPRRFHPLTHYAFMLIDPRADTFDLNELARLSDELQTKLFGVGDETEEGQVALLLFEGSPEAAAVFAHMDPAQVATAVRTGEGLPDGGRLSRVVSPGAVEKGAEVLHSSPEWVVDVREQEAEGPPPAQMPTLEGAQGIYFTLREVFIGDVLSSTPGSLTRHLSLVEGGGHMPQDTESFDAGCVLAAVRFLTEHPNTMLYLPICYSNLVRPTKAAEYQTLFSLLPGGRRQLLAAAVYDVPRSPVFGALSKVRDQLLPHVSSIDLRISDPAFEVETLTEGAVTSVTLTLPDAETKVRHAVLRRFSERKDFYKRKKIWPGVTNIRNREDLELCWALKIPFLTGPAVCRMQSQPIGGRKVPISDLPVLAA